MKENTTKSTSDLSHELSSSPALDHFLDSNREVFIDPDIGNNIQIMLQQKDLPKAELARRSGMSTVYLYQLLNGRRSPSRDRMLCICIGLGLDLAETQAFLEKNLFAGLYVKIRREAIISYGLEKHLDINEINDLLYENEEETLI